MLSRPTPLQKLFSSKEDEERAEKFQDATQKVISNYLNKFNKQALGK